LRRLWRIVLLITILSLWSVARIRAEQAVTMPYVKVSKVVVDGVVMPGEYAGSYLESDTGITVSWEHNGTYMYVALVSPGTGWVGVGFGPKLVGMDGANIIIGYVDGGGVLTLVDEIGVGHGHYSDVNRGGRDNIIRKAGSEKEGKTIVEFVFPLNSGDLTDHAFEPGNTYGFFVGYQASRDDLTSYHTAYSATIDLYIQPGEAPPPAENRPPNANFTYTTRGFTVKFTDLSSDPDGKVTSWQWSFGDGSTPSTDQNSTHTFSEMGRYTVTLLVKDDKGATNAVSKRVVVPSGEERFQLWTSQVILVSTIVALLSFFAVGIAASREKKGGAKKWL